MELYRGSPLSRGFRISSSYSGVIVESELEKLRNSLAILRGIEFFQRFRPQSHVTRTQWAAYLEGLYHQVHHGLFRESAALAMLAPLKGGEHISAPQTRGYLSIIFSHFAQRFFDANGFYSVADIHAAAPELAWLYQQLMQTSCFGRDTGLVTRLFFSLIGEMRGFREKLGGIDFRRLSSAEVEIFRHSETSLTQLAEVFIAAMQRGRDLHYPAQLPPYPAWPDYSVTIEGLRFLALPADSSRILWQEGATPQPVIVLTNGRVVPEAEFRQQLKQYLQHDLPVGRLRISRRYWCGILAGLPDYFADSTVIDYEAVSDAAAPLCLSLHPLTALTYPEHQQLEQYLKMQHAAGMLVLENQETAAVILTATLDPDLRGLLELASARIQKITSALRQQVVEIIAAHPAARCGEKTRPHFLMTMGGSGSGKNSNRFYRERIAGKDYIYASLDDSRSGNDIFHVLIAAGHHADDYEAVHQWADLRRKWLCEAALEARMNLIYDGSGIEYAGRYDAIVARFDLAGYETEIIAADCLLVVPDVRREEYPTSALERIMARSSNAGDHYRTLPWRVAINKHIGFPSSFLAAFHDVHLHRLTLVDNAGRAGEEKLVAEMQIVADESALARAVKGIPAFLIQERGRQQAILRIYHPGRMVDVLEKAQLNPNAHSPQALTWLKRSASFLIDRLDKPQGISTIPAKAADTGTRPRDMARSNYLRLNGG